MDTRYNMIIIKGEIKTTEVMSCVYDTKTHKWNVKFNNGKSYLYAYMNVEKLTKPDVLNPKSYPIQQSALYIGIHRQTFYHSGTTQQYVNRAHGNPVHCRL